MADVYALRQELEEAHQRVGYLEQLADQDTLAPVLNRRAFIRELGRMAAFEERYGAAGAVLYFDVNDLKASNDRYGHAAGDAVLKQICEILLRETRASDVRSEEHTSELQSLMRISYAVFCLQKKKEQD